MDKTKNVEQNNQDYENRVRENGFLPAIGGYARSSKLIYMRPCAGRSFTRITIYTPRNINSSYRCGNQASTIGGESTAKYTYRVSGFLSVRCQVSENAHAQTCRCLLLVATPVGKKTIGKTCYRFRLVAIVPFLFIILKINTL